MSKISLVIITFNAENMLDKVLTQAKKLTKDIVVVDSFSTDKTETIAKEFEVNFHKKEWEGYGSQKNYANKLALNNWILSIDADEVLSNELIDEIKALNLNDENLAFNIPFKNNYCGKLIKHGRWKNEHHVRLFNKKTVSWNTSQVHEGLNLSSIKIIDLKNPIFHFSMQSKEQHLAKAKKYAEMGASRMYKQGKKATFIKQYINPMFRFINDYIFSLGFLDGKLGFQLAYIISKETYWKYQKLDKLHKV